MRPLFFKELTAHANDNNKEIDIMKINKLLILLFGLSSIGLAAHAMSAMSFVTKEACEKSCAGSKCKFYEPPPSKPSKPGIDITMPINYNVPTGWSCSLNLN